MFSAKLRKLVTGVGGHRNFSWVQAISLFTAVAIVWFVSGVWRFDVSEALKNPEEHSASAHVGGRSDWKYGEDLPDFCKMILKDPHPQSDYCDRDYQTMKCQNDTTYQMFSQFHQDYFLYTQHFKHLKRPGIYLDIAANEPVSLSNTFFMDRCLGWEGVCVEGNPGYHEKLYRERSCHLVPTCVGSRDGQAVKFGLKSGSGGIIGETYKHTEKFAELGIEVPVINVRCVTMKTVLEKNGVTLVDYLSLDVEGHELEVLKGFDWDNVIINLMSIEVSPNSRKEIEDFLTPKGYRELLPDLFETTHKNLLRGDAIFAHETVEFGKPR